jgi:hypothetical protein
MAEGKQERGSMEYIMCLDGVLLLLLTLNSASIV